jgi:hypothetical protein
MQGLRSRAFTGQRVQPASRTSLNVVCKESRIGMKPVPIPKGVTIDLKGQNLKVKVRKIKDGWLLLQQSFSCHLRQRPAMLQQPGHGQRSDSLATASGLNGSAL